MLNFVNVIGQMYFVNFFLGGVFMTYGTDVLNFINMDDEDRSDPMMEVFPRVTKCTFHKYGSSGTIMKLDALCVLGRASNEPSRSFKLYSIYIYILKCESEPLFQALLF